MKDLALAAKELGRYGFRDFLLITVAYRHALRVSELIDLRGQDASLADVKARAAKQQFCDQSGCCFLDFLRRMADLPVVFTVIEQYLLARSNSSQCDKDYMLYPI